MTNMAMLAINTQVLRVIVISDWALRLSSSRSMAQAVPASLRVSA